MRSMTWFGSLVALAAAGCGTDPIDRALAQAEVNADVICECPEAIGRTTEAECRAFFEETQPTATEEDCLRRVYAAYSAELDPVLDCQYEAGVAFTDCLRPVVAMCPADPMDLSDCTMSFGTANEACPRPSDQATAELSACFASRP